MPRKPLGDVPLTVAQKSANKRRRKAAKLEAVAAGIESAMAARTIRDAREILAPALAAVRSLKPT